MLSQSRVWVARVSGARGARCAPFTAPVGVLVEITLQVQHHGSRCALLYSARACRCSCFLSHFASLFRDAFCLCRRSAFDSAGASSLRLVSAGSLALFLSLPATWRSALAFACSAPVSALLLSHLCLGYASRSSRATSTEHLFFNAAVHITVKEYK